MGQSTWDKISAIIAEACGTAAMIFTGCLCVCYFQSTLLEISFAFGIAIMMVTQMFAHVSGAYFNPSVTIGAMIHGIISFPMCIMYICAQFTGAILGYGGLKLLLPDKLPNDEDGVCLTTANRDLSTFQILLVEFVATTILVWVNCGFWDPRNAKYGDSMPIISGLTITALSLVFSPLTGASMNPARSFAPAMLTNNWERQWVYWVAPPISGLISSVVYKKYFWRSHVYTNRIKGRDY